MLTFWEDDIHHIIDKIENIILRSCNLEKKLFSNDTFIKEIDNDITKEFINNNSIKKYIESDINLGLFKDNVLLFVMSFSSNNNLDYTLNQICYKNNLYVINSEKLLLDYFINNYKVNKIIAYCDLEIENKKLYDKLGFKLNNDKLKFNLSYYNYRTTEHRINKKEVNQLLKLDDSDSLEDYMKCYSGYLIYKKENV